ncbi:MAG: hypothetical protein ACRCU2_02025 [Planktothrix sp.]
MNTSLIFPPFPRDNQIHKPHDFEHFKRVYQYHMGRTLQDFPRNYPNLIAKTDHGSWVANTDYNIIAVPINPSIDDNPTEFMAYKHLSTIKWHNTENTAVFHWIAQLNHWIELDY